MLLQVVEPVILPPDSVKQVVGEVIGKIHEDPNTFLQELGILLFEVKPIVNVALEHGNKSNK